MKSLLKENVKRKNVVMNVMINKKAGEIFPAFNFA